ncbi:MAG TPA: VOC family protein [Marmoricola sp.]|nr:VOC family protein [Marmoricola sp.]
MTTHHGTHNDLHTDAGALPGEHPGRARNPVIKVRGLAWLEFVKPDLAASERFATAFGFTVVSRTAEELQLRGSDEGSPCVIVRREKRSAYVGAAFHAADAADLVRLADATGATVEKLPEAIGGAGVRLVDPSGVTVRVVADTHPLPALPVRSAAVLNVGDDARRTNATQRPPREPARIRRLGHVVLQTTRYRQTLDWYLEHLGLIVSDFKYFDGQRDRGPTMSFIRCDQGQTPTDHHTLAMMLGPSNRYVHSAYEVTDLDTLAAGGEYLLDQGFQRSWGIGRHIEGSQIFDYWRDPDGLLVEHYTDGDLFDSSLEPGWSPMTASGLAQWGPPATRDFLGLRPGRASLQEAMATARALREDNEFDLDRLRGLLKVIGS